MIKNKIFYESYQMSPHSCNKTKWFIRISLPKDDGDRFCLNCFCNFQIDEKLEQHQK